jgi:hypothetical protein
VTFLNIAFLLLKNPDLTTAELYACTLRQIMHNSSIQKKIEMTFVKNSSDYAAKGIAYIRNNPTVSISFAAMDMSMLSSIAAMDTPEGAFVRAMRGDDMLNPHAFVLALCEVTKAASNELGREVESHGSCLFIKPETTSELLNQIQPDYPGQGQDVDAPGPAF